MDSHSSDHDNNYVPHAVYRSIKFWYRALVQQWKQSLLYYHSTAIIILCVHDIVAMSTCE